MYEKLENCPACKHIQFNNFIICKDHYVSQESFALVKCTKCQLVFTNPRPSHDRFIQYRNAPKGSNAQLSKGLVNTIVKRITGRFKREVILKIKTSGSLLDYGLYDHKFLDNMGRTGWEISGIKTHHVPYNKPQSLISIHENIDAIPSATQYDIITAWHTLDQTHDLRSTFKKLKKRLKSDGLMFIALTNHNSLDAKKYREAWAAYDQPRSLYHFSVDSFTRFVKQNRMTVLDVVPMKFYSYYVSVLSENITNSKNTYVNAFTSGLKSNKSAKINNDQYSSLIYILTK